MTIYIESFLIQNALINFCLLRLIYLTTKPKTKNLKLFFASVLGAVLSAIAVIFNGSTVGIMFKILTPVAMLAIAFRQRKKQYIFNFALFYLFGFAFAGMLAVVGNKIDNLNSNFSSFEALTIVAIIFSYIFEFVVAKIKYKIKTNNLIYPITLSLNKRKIKINAFLDTGNLLSYNSRPVVVVDLKSYLELTKTDLINFYLEKGEQISLNTVAGSNSVKIFKLDEMAVEINGKIKTFKNQYIAVNTLNIFKSSNYQALINPEMI